MCKEKEQNKIQNLKEIRHERKDGQLKWEGNFY